MKLQKNGVNSFIFGIVGFLTSIIPFVGLVLGIFGIIYAKRQNKKSATNLSTAGMTLSILSIILNGLIILFFITATLSSAVI